MANHVTGSSGTRLFFSCGNLLYNVGNSVHITQSAMTDVSYAFVKYPIEYTIGILIGPSVVPVTMTTYGEYRMYNVASDDNVRGQANIDPAEITT